MLFRFVTIPLYLKMLGVEEYGFYQYIFSVASYAVILDFGISSVINKFAIEFREKGDRKGEENVMFYALMFSLLATALIIIGGFVLCVGAPAIFGQVVEGRLMLTRQMLVLMLGELIALMFQHYFEGVILAAEKYVTLRTVALVQIFLRFGMTALLLFSNVGVMSIAAGDFIGAILCLLYEAYYCKAKLNLKIKYHYYDKRLLMDIIKLTMAIALQSVVSYLHSSIDKYVLGRYLTTAAVTIYSLALTFSSCFDEIPTAIQRLYLPQAVKLVASGADGEEITSFIIKPGRYQFMLAGAALGGFVLFGRQFIMMWSGEDTLDAWLVALFLMVPSLLPLIQNVCLSILTAMNKRHFRSFVLCAIAVLNLVTTIILVKWLGLMGAAIATAISLIIGNNIVMNLYYKYALHLNVIRMFKGILKGILPCVLLATAVCAPLLLIPLKGLIWFGVECIIFCVVYFGLLWLMGMNAEEKGMILSKVKRAK